MSELYIKYTEECYNNSPSDIAEYINYLESINNEQIYREQNCDNSP
jgi:hypothetical protein